MAFYFAWMGYFACYLLPAAVICSIIFLTGVSVANDPDKNVIEYVRIRKKAL